MEHAATSSESKGPASRFAPLRTVSAVLVLSCVAVLAGAPTPDQVQILLAVLTVSTFFLMGWLRPSGGPFRSFVSLLIVFTSTRYMIWRVTETMPSDSPLSIVGGVFLLGAESYGYVLLLLSTFLSVDVYKRAPRPAPLAPAACPTVDILIPSYNEPDELLEVTLTAALNVNYPDGRSNVYLLDDGGTVAKRNNADPVKAAEAQDRFERLQEMCARLGAHYLTREKNDHAKAGNINAALTSTSGELILILDADHVPSNDILTRTVGYFVEDPKLFLVQTPHFFLNPDPLERNLGTFKNMPSENEMFYSVIQRGLDGLNASFFCGSAAVLRRELIMEIGGIQGDTITEDAETALELHSRGYRSAYVDRPMVAGLSPETFSGFIVQRMRWTQGMVQIFLLKNPLLKKGLTFAQRVGYFNSCFYWFFPLARMAFILGPLLYLLFGIQVYVGTLSDFLMYGLPHIVGALMLSSMLYGHTRWAFASELYEVIQSIHCSGAILTVLRNPRSPSFAVTPKGENLDENFVSPLARPFYILILIVCIGEVAGIARWFLDPVGAGVISVLLFWNTFHLLLLVSALGVLYERSQQRVFPRFQTSRDITLNHLGTPMPGHMTDVSITGMGATVPTSSGRRFEVGDVVQADARDLGAAAASSLDLKVLSAQDTPEGQKLGLSFLIETQDQWTAVVALMYARSENWKTFRDDRATSENMMSKIGGLVRSSLSHAMTHIQAVSREART
ncbi:UDP-forming cellulose synthase catalytic subunit [Hyphomonas johnsonii]|uniref:Cellulose synthase catalytic subunit [UDP-forming] n=1 Tax=Hyphomonas johnsonii MHS-2 TaxID=1280950 RepID=A0A059FNI0_9PROT|nr:UDP-forming cellulose synthase catalytic subunit [Hyphomonas johnsonii]KCZ92245.1 putative cellulose synthase catalytic subunit [Hyphomonas johnsonii MHS-2]